MEQYIHVIDNLFSFQFTVSCINLYCAVLNCLYFVSSCVNPFAFCTRGVGHSPEKTVDIPPCDAFYLPTHRPFKITSNITEEAGYVFLVNLVIFLILSVLLTH